MSNQKISSTESPVNEHLHRGVDITKIISLYGGTEDDWTEKIEELSGSELNKLKRAIGDKEPLLTRIVREYIFASS